MNESSMPLLRDRTADIEDDRFTRESGYWLVRESGLVKSRSAAPCAPGALSLAKSTLGSGRELQAVAAFANVNRRGLPEAAHPEWEAFFDNPVCTFRNCLISIRVRPKLDR
jgi:hypothetical protein